MDIQTLLKYADHTLLGTTSTEEDVKEHLNDGMKYSVASCCIPPNFVKMAKEYVGDKLKVCTVVGFPNGYNEACVKVYETEKAIANGADEIDMVINIGALKSGDSDYVLDEIKQIKAACGDKVLKVIIESCLLTEDEKITMCRIVTQSGADFIKTSTGFSTGGATFSDVELLKKHVGSEVKVKAAGGISSIADAEKFISLGASRLGTSKLVKIAKEMGI